jgi:hypothetical protein
MQGKRNAIGSAIPLFRDSLDLAEFRRRKPMTARAKQAISRALKGKKKRKRKGIATISQVWGGKKHGLRFGSPGFGTAAAVGTAAGLGAGVLLLKRGQNRRIADLDRRSREMRQISDRQQWLDGWQARDNA